MAAMSTLLITEKRSNEKSLPINDRQALRIVAEGQGFEPWKGYKPLAVFKTAAIDHSAIPPAYGDAS